MSDLVRNIFRLIIFIFLQVYVLSKIPHLHRFITPYIYYLFILWLPFSLSRISLLFIGFMTGLILDYFLMTPGLHAAACLLVAYIRPFIINLLTPKEASAFTYREPSAKAMQWGAYTFYVFILTLLHHTYLVFLEWLDFGGIVYFFMKVLATTAISMAMILAAELLFPRRLKFRTNTA